MSAISFDFNEFSEDGEKIAPKKTSIIQFSNSYPNNKKNAKNQFSAVIFHSFFMRYRVEWPISIRFFLFVSIERMRQQKAIIKHSLSIRDNETMALMQLFFFAVLFCYRFYCFLFVLKFYLQIRFCFSFGWCHFQWFTMIFILCISEVTMRCYWHTVHILFRGLFNVFHRTIIQINLFLVNRFSVFFFSIQCLWLFGLVFFFICKNRCDCFYCGPSCMLLWVKASRNERSLLHHNFFFHTTYLYSEAKLTIPFSFNFLWVFDWFLPSLRKLILDFFFHVWSVRIFVMRTKYFCL